MDTRKAFPSLIAGLMLVPLAFLTWLLIEEKNRGIELAQKEKQGLEYVLPVSKAARLAALHRGLSFGYLNGNRTLLPRIEDAQARMDKAVAEVEAADARFGNVLRSTASWQAARSEWQKLKTWGLNLAPAESFAQHTAAIDKLLGLIREQSEASGLLFNSQADSYFLVDVALVRMPRMLEDLGQLRGRGSPMFRATALTEDDRLFVAGKIALIRVNVAGIDSSVASASKYNSAVKEELGQAQQGFLAATQPFVSAAELEILKGQRQLDPDRFFELGTKAIGAGTRYIDIAETTLQALLDERVKALQQNKVVAIAVSGFIVALVFVGTTILMQSVIAQEALRKAREELEQRVAERTSELKQTNVQLQMEIAERERAEAVLEQKSQELARSNVELEQFAYVASHDLQEPLRMVGSYVQLLEKRYQDRLDADGREFIAYAVDGAKRMQTLINDLLAYSRIGTKGLPFQPTDCEAVFAAALSNLRVTLQESDARITHDPLPKVMGDATQLTQLFQNLLANAIKFRGNQRPQIQVQVEPREGPWCFSVRDNGIGIAPEYRSLRRRQRPRPS